MSTYVYCVIGLDQDIFTEDDEVKGPQVPIIQIFKKKRDAASYIRKQKVHELNIYLNFYVKHTEDKKEFNRDCRGVTNDYLLNCLEKDERVEKNGSRYSMKKGEDVDLLRKIYMRCVDHEDFTGSYYEYYIRSKIVQ